MLGYLYAHQLLYYCLVLLLSASIALIIIPSILHVARKRHLYDDLGHFRKQHDHGIPRLGGVAMFAGFIITVLMLGVGSNSLSVNYLISACIVLLALGLKDDLHGVNPSTKFLVQSVIAFILVIGGDIRLTDLLGFLGLHQLPYLISAVLSIFSIILVMNAFNLIDGINGLAGSLSLMANVTFAVFFIHIGQYQLAALALAMVGAVFGFLKYNITPAKLFMGDTGSMLIGLISVILGIEAINYSRHVPADFQVSFSVPALVAAALITPLFDTACVIVIRLTNGTSPFRADRNHIHHRLLKLRFSHLQATFLLIAINIAVIVLVVFSGISNTLVAVTGIVGVYSLLNWLLVFLLRSKKRENLALRNLFV
ncbi:MraY family glycosyltransferase [Mucilaginibacter sp.]